MQLKSVSVFITAVMAIAGVQALPADATNPPKSLESAKPTDPWSCTVRPWDKSYYDRIRLTAQPEEYCRACDRDKLWDCEYRSDKACLAEMNKICHYKGPERDLCKCRGEDECDRLAGNHTGPWEYRYECNPSPFW